MCFQRLSRPYARSELNAGLSDGSECLLTVVVNKNVDLPNNFDTIIVKTTAVQSSMTVTATAPNTTDYTQNTLAAYRTITAFVHLFWLLDDRMMQSTRSSLFIANFFQKRWVTRGQLAWPEIINHTHQACQEKPEVRWLTHGVLLECTNRLIIPIGLSRKHSARVGWPLSLTNYRAGLTVICFFGLRPAAANSGSRAVGAMCSRSGPNCWWAFLNSIIKIKYSVTLELHHREPIKY